MQLIYKGIKILLFFSELLMVIAEIMKIFVIFLFIHLTNAGSDIRVIECIEGCKQGPIKLRKCNIVFLNLLNYVYKIPFKI